VEEESRKTKKAVPEGTVPKQFAGTAVGSAVPVLVKIAFVLI